MEDLRIKLAVLWLIFEVATLAFSLVWLMEPGVIDQFRAGVVEGVEMGPVMLMVLAIVFVVPLAMTFLSLTSKNPTNRWTNIILGLVFIVLVIITGHYTYTHAILIMLSQLAALALIVWYAWKWPKQED